MYRERLKVYLWSFYSLIACLLLAALYLLLFGFNLGAAIFFVFCWIGVAHKVSLKLGIAILRDLASNNFKEQKGTFIKQTPMDSFFQIPLRWAKNNYMDRPVFYNLTFNHGKYFYLKAPLYFEVEKDKKYLLTFAERSKILVDVKEFDGTEVPNSEMFSS